MSINKHITHLLHFHNYVVIPGFGGFIAKEQPAKINVDGNIIHPPGKEIAFNTSLNTGDGLLLQELVKKDGLSYSQAEVEVQNLSAVWMKTLDLGRIVNIDGLGQLRRNVQGKIIFRQNSYSNFLVSSFGLETVSLPGLSVSAGNEQSASVSKPQTIVIEQLPVSYKRFKIASLAAIVLLSISATYLYMLSFNPHVVDQAGLNFFKVPIIEDSELDKLNKTKDLLDKTEEVLAETEESSKSVLKNAQASTVEDEPIAPSEDTTNEETDSQKAADINNTNPAQEEQQEEVPEPIEPSPSQTYEDLYHVIVSVISDENKIDGEVLRFRQKGYSPKVISTEQGTFRISIGHFATKDSASTFRQNILNDNNISSWILTP